MKPTPSLPSLLIPGICLFLSGAASLVYELIWLKQLSLVFGGTLYAISAVLCAFMVGLALGAWGISRYLTTRREPGLNIHPVRLYGILEGMIGVYALLFPLGLEGLSRLYPLALETAGSGLLLHLLEFFAAAVLMLPATCLMGATLPLVGSWRVGDRAQGIFSEISLLYSINTFGAVAGCLYTQMAGIRWLGIRGTTLTAVGLNAAVFLVCLRYRAGSTGSESQAPPPFARPIRIKPDEGGERVPTPFLSGLLLFVFFFSGLASLSSEILWTRILVFPMGSSLYSFALILATFLFGIAAGSLAAEKVLGNSRWIYKFLWIEILIGAACIAILPLFNRLPEWTLAADRMFYGLDSSPARTLGIRSLFAFGLMLPPTLGFGMIFPLANRIHLALFSTVSRTLGNSYSVNTMGAVLGTVLTPFVLIPLWGIRLSIFLLYAVLILLSMWGLGLHRREPGAKICAFLAGTAGLIVGGYFYASPAIETGHLGRNNLARTEIDVSPQEMRLLDYLEGEFATLSVVEDTGTGARTIYMDGFSTATVSGSIGGSAYMQAMGFVPALLHPDPKEALVICFGTGNTMGTVSLFPGLHVDGVEIDRNVLGMARWFVPWNHDVLARPNAELFVQDGRSFLRWTRNRYDLITLEPMSPVQAGVVNLYSREFYELARDRLNEDGVMMQWLPLHLVGPEDARAIIHTFQEVFPYTSAWNSFLTRIVLLVGSKTPHTLDRKRFERLMQVPELETAARQIGVFSFLDLADFFLTGGEALKSYLRNAPVITDDRPILEHSPVTLVPPLIWQTDESFLNLLRHRVQSSPPLTGVTREEGIKLQQDLDLRTAQRLAVFSRRYHGPGEAAFANGNFLGGLEQVRNYLESAGETPVSLAGARWNGIR